MKKVRIGMVGMGQRTCFHGGIIFSGCKKDVEIVAVCDNRKDRLEYGVKAYSDEFKCKVKGYLDYKEMFQKEELDGVFIATPNYIHKDIAVAALEKGIDVLCEKPMELSLKKCDEMTKAANKAKKILAFGMQMHYRARYHKVKELVQKGAIGKIAQVWCTEYRGPYGEMKDWVWDKKLSGGAIFEKNCHHYDLLNWWVDSMPTTVYASGNILKHKKPYGIKSEIIDNAWVINDYENGARAMLGINFLADPRKEHYREFGLIGTEGKIFFSWADGEIIHVEYNSLHKEHYEMIQNQWIRGGLEQDFVNCIRSGKQPLITSDAAKNSLLVPMAAELSMDEKRIVHVNELK